MMVLLWNEEMLLPCPKSLLDCAKLSYDVLNV